MKTLEEMRKEASVLKIKNYTKYNKVELANLIEEAKKQNNSNVTPNLPAVIYVSIFDEMKKKQNKKMELPREGTQARKIYDIFANHIGHKKWTVYRVVKDNGFSLNNVRRIYKKYFEAINKEIFEAKSK